MINKYFFLTEKIKSGTAFAYAEDELSLSHLLISEVKTKVECPFELTLKKVNVGKNGIVVSDDLSEVKYLWVDYQPNNLAWPLMSNKMKEIIISHLTGQESIVWIKIKVKGSNEIRDYFIPCFQRKLDVLNLEKTSFVSGTAHVIKPVFSLKKISNYAMFHKSQELFWEITSGLYVNEIVKDALLRKKITGIDFEKIVVM